MQEIKASLEDVVGEDKVSAKTAPLERKKIQFSLMPLTIRVARRLMRSIKAMSR